MKDELGNKETRNEEKGCGSQFEKIIILST